MEGLGFSRGGWVYKKLFKLLLAFFMVSSTKLIFGVLKITSS